MSKLSSDLEKLKEEIILKGYTTQTLKSYLIHVKMYINFLKERKMRPSVESAKQFLSYLIVNQEYSSSSISAVKAAVVFYLKKVKGIKVSDEEIPTPKKEKKLPTVLSREEIKKLIRCAETDRERMIVLLLYSTGLRVSELVKLKVRDFDLDDGILYVRSGKGKKDRVVILSKKMCNILREYFDKNNITEEDYVFFSKHKNNHLSVRTIQKIIRNLKEKAHINKEVTPHVLRHTFATHLLEEGENIRKIQILLGHSNLQTTQIYTKVSIDELKKTKNILDRLI